MEAAQGAGDANSMFRGDHPGKDLYTHDHIRMAAGEVENPQVPINAVNILWLSRDKSFAIACADRTGGKEA